MRGINLQAARVHQVATQLLKSNTITQAPPWYEVIGRFPPGEFMTRNLPIQLQEQTKTHSRKRKPSKIFRPQKIEYEEDKLRHRFYSDHPWELARPRIVLETYGKDWQNYDWSRIEQTDKPLDGESVVQRQIWLLENVPEMTTVEAYDIARKEFYALRRSEEVERRIAKEEALSYGAQFGPGPIEWGMKLEDMMYKSWKIWAQKKLEDIQLKQEAGLYHDISSEEVNETESLPNAV
ncbi:hypothetical protein EPUL_004302 [Erysiphe pulchra]|uniref:37S ribosomal protein S25, mitochondrial n=1 Tax=Erysiphe pulchra TaxID=225359 RepID=A0A2S4PS34_9PEZI|nr:hypothetical protein EPUL_004302 [Erysiphe pulchra]